MMNINLKNNTNTIYELSRKQVKAQYRDSTFGFIWTILNPLLTMLVMWFVFSNMFGGDDPYYPLYLLTGNILFTALRNSTSQSLQSFVNNRGLLLRTKIDLYVFPFSYIVSSLINFAFSLIALIPFMIWRSVDPGINLFSYQLVFLLLMFPSFFLFELGIGLILSSIYVFFRDIKHIYNVFLVLWTYLTPIFYKPGIIAKKAPVVFEIMQFNPMFQFMKYFRECAYAGAAGRDLVATTTSAEALGFAYIPVWTTLGWCYLSGVVFFLIGFVLFKILKSKIIVRV